MEIHLLSTRGNFCTKKCPFCKLPCDKTGGQTGYSKFQMKGVTIILPLIPLNYLWVKWFGYNIPSKSSVLNKKIMKMDQLCSEAKFNFWDTFS